MTMRRRSKRNTRRERGNGGEQRKYKHKAGVGCSFQRRSSLPHRSMLRTLPNWRAAAYRLAQCLTSLIFICSSQVTSLVTPPLSLSLLLAACLCIMSRLFSTLVALLCSIALVSAEWHPANPHAPQAPQAPEAPQAPNAPNAPKPPMPPSPGKLGSLGTGYQPMPKTDHLNTTEIDGTNLKDEQLGT
jgi:hypothetical protein